MSQSISETWGLISPASAADISERHPLVANLLSRYAWAYDFSDATLLATCFTRDCEVSFQGDLKVGRDAVIVELMRRRSAYPDEQTPWHVVSNILIRAADRESTVVASWFSFGVMACDKPPVLNSFGWYDDFFIVEDGEWRVHRRRVLKPWDR